MASLLVAVHVVTPICGTEDIDKRGLFHYLVQTSVLIHTLGRTFGAERRAMPYEVTMLIIDSQSDLDLG